MTDFLTAETVAWTAAMAVAGASFGVVYLAALRRTVDAIAGGTGWHQPLLLTVGRLVAAVVLLGLAAQLGPIPLLAAFGGFLAVRAVILRRARRAS